METTQRSLSPVPEGAANADSFRALPHNIEAEQALLGAVLINNDSANRVSDFLLPEHFFEPVHGRIYDAVLKMIERGQLANPVTLKTYFENDEGLAEIGGAQYLARLAGSAVTVINARHYGRTIHDLAIRRALIELGEEVVNTAYDPDVEMGASEQIEETEQKLFHLAEEGQPEGGFKALETSLTGAISMMEAAYKREAMVTGVATGLTDIDDLLGGLHPSDLVIIAGRPSMGKTALATNIAFNAARAYKEERDENGELRVIDGAKVGFFSLEMAAEQLATRMLAEVSGIDSDRLRRGKMGKEDFLNVVQASQDLADIPFFIDDTAALTMGQLRTRARRLKRQQGLGLIVVDYLQLLRPAGRSRPDNRVQEISEVTQGLKALAKELDVPVLALSQLSRAVEQREDKRPQLADLRESGAIEQDADVVMFIFREEYYLRRADPMKRADESDEKFNERYDKWRVHFEKVEHIAELIVAKQRHGPIGTCKLRFAHATTKFESLADSERLPDVPF